MTDNVFPGAIFQSWPIRRKSTVSEIQRMSLRQDDLLDGLEFLTAAIGESDVNGFFFG